MPDTEESLCNEYAAWNKANGLKLGSADEHTFDEDLTEAQRAYLRIFCDRWNAWKDAERERGERGKV